MPAMSSPVSALAHKRYEDILALVTGTLFVALGVRMYQHAGLLSGGTVGMAFVLHYASGWTLPLLMLLINLPFYALAFARMGAAFAIKTLAAVALLAGYTHFLPQGLQFSLLHPLLASLLGGALMGSGMLILFRHRASLGGLNVLVLYLQERFGWRAGLVQMGLDCAIVAAALTVVPWERVALSVLGAIVVNQTLATNHRAGRYVAM